MRSHLRTSSEEKGIEKHTHPIDLNEPIKLQVGKGEPPIFEGEAEYLER